MFNNSPKLAYMPEERICSKCGKTFTTNHYGYESLCPTCRKKQERIDFLKSPIKELIKTIIEHADR